VQHQILEQCEINSSTMGFGNKAKIINATSATLSLVGVKGAKVVLSRAAGIAVALPAATGDGSVLEFFLATTTTSNAYVLTANGSDTVAGTALMDDGDGEPANGWAATAATVITLGGTSNATGGIKGGKVTLTDIAAGLWHADVTGAQSGAEATPFS